MMQCLDKLKLRLALNSRILLPWERYRSDLALTAEFEDQMVKLVREYVREGEYLSVHHPDEPGAGDNAPDCTALALFASKTGKIGEILLG